MSSIEYIKTKNKVSPTSFSPYSCDTCGTTFKMNETRNKWRMYADNRPNSFWIIHCNECFKENINQWRDKFTNLSNSLENIDNE